MSKEQKLRQSICNYLYTQSNGQTRVDPKTLRSVKTAIDSNIIEDVSKFKEYFDTFDKHVSFIDDIKNPYGIYKFMQNYARSSGKEFTRKETFTDNKTKEEYTNEIFDYYVPDNEEEYVIVIVDHASLINPEKGQTTHEAITKLSSDYFVTLRNRYNFIPVLIQQQASSQESIDNMKANKLKPTLDGLGDNKLTQRDCNVAFGLFSPFRHRIKTYPEKDGYDITYFKDNIRFLEVLASREGGGNTICPLYFDGAVNFFKELPTPDEVEKLNNIKKFINNVRKNKT